MDSLRKLIERNEGCAFGKFASDNNMSKEYLSASISESVGTLLSKDNTVAETLWEERTGKTVGVVVAEEARWDTDHFGRRIGKITLALFDEEVGSEQREENMERISKRTMAEMLSARINLTDLKTIQALERMGARLTDVLLTYRFDFSTSLPSLHAPKTRITPVEEGEAEELARIGSEVFAIDRFHGDPSFSTAKSNELYSKWVLNSVNGLADTVLVARDGDRVAGFITCKVEQLGSTYKFGVIDLVGVRPSFAGLGVGRELVHSALEWFSGKVPSVYVGTQAANSRAVRLYESSRFRHACSEATLHRWSDSIPEGLTR
jgi:ribosomal protein S18 acetylase RimI-like enzyme